MHQTSHHFHPFEEPVARALLGVDDPLVRAMHRQRVRLEQSLVVGVVLSASVAALASGASAALAVVLAAAIVESVLACDAAALRYRIRDRVLVIIAQGRGDLPLCAVARERRRLCDRGHQERLARWLDDIRADARGPRRDPRARPIFSPAVIRAVTPHLSAIGTQLRSEHADLRGVAAMERLLVDGASPLYGRDQVVLSEELRRIRYLFEA